MHNGGGGSESLLFGCQWLQDVLAGLPSRLAFFMPSSYYLVLLISRCEETQFVMTTIHDLWQSTNEQDWNNALEHYWTLVQPKNLELERELNDPKLELIERLDPIAWYDFLHDKYFRWKYTAANRYATTTNKLRTYKTLNQLDDLFNIKRRLLSFDTSDVSAGLSIACEIRGLGIAGASGLLSIMYPKHFGTVDQFVVKALWQIPDLSQKPDVNKMKPEALTLRDGILLIHIMRTKASQNHKVFGREFWTPRKIDMVLWAVR